MNRLLTRTLHHLLALDFFKKKNEDPPLSLPDPGSPIEPEPEDLEEDSEPCASDPLADHGAAIHQIQDCTRILQQTCKKVDKDFLGIGERLQTIYGQADDLTRKASSTVEQMGTDSGDNVLTRVTQTAGEALEELRQKQTRIQDNLARVAAIGDQLQTLLQMGDQLRVIARFLKMVGVNISIESSRSDDGQEIFVSLAKEIRELAVTVIQVARSFGSDTQHLHAHVAAMHREMSVKLEHFRQLAEAAKNSIEHATPNVQAIISRSVDALAHVGADAQVISQSVAQIVVSLQIHDNVSQRVEHIVEALTDVTQDRRQPPSDDGPVDDGIDAITALDANLALQIAQLEQVIRDVEDAHQVGTRAFEKISRTIENIAQNMNLAGNDEGTGAPDGAVSSSSVEALQITLKEINTMIGCGNETVSELQGITQSTTTAISRIEKHMHQVREVNFDIHLKSLNAMFKSIRLGSKGKAIEALVQEMKELANQSNDFVSRVNDISGTIVDSANMLRDQFDSACDINSQGSEENSGRLDTGIEVFSAACKVFEQSTEETVVLGHHLGDLIEHAASELIFVKTFAGDLTAQLGQLKDLRRQVSPGGETDHSHLSLVKAQIAASYTMQQERDIHDRILSRGADATANSTDDENITSQNPSTESDNPICRATDDETCDEFDDNIELF